MSLKADGAAVFTAHGTEVYFSDLLDDKAAYEAHARRQWAVMGWPEQGIEGFVEEANKAQ